MMPDNEAMDAIHAAMDAAEWNADLWDVVSVLVLATGRQAFRSPDDEEVPA